MKISEYTPRYPCKSMADCVVQGARDCPECGLRWTAEERALSLRIDTMLNKGKPKLTVVKCV